MVTLNGFKKDSHGGKYTDVLTDHRVQFQVVVDYFNRKDVARRMVESEKWHDRPPLAGVVKEFEDLEAIKKLLSEYDAHTTVRFRQAVGVLISMHMESLGYRKTGKKGSLGTRASTATGSTAPGAYQNSSGLSKWFTKCERYELQE